MNNFHEIKIDFSLIRFCRWARLPIPVALLKLSAGKMFGGKKVLINYQSIIITLSSNIYQCCVKKA